MLKTAFIIKFNHGLSGKFPADMEWSFPSLCGHMATGLCETSGTERVDQAGTQMKNGIAALVACTPPMNVHRNKALPRTTEQ